MTRRIYTVFVIRLSKRGVSRSLWKCSVVNGLSGEILMRGRKDGLLASLSAE